MSSAREMQAGMGEGPDPFSVGNDATLDPWYVSGGDPSQFPTYTPPVFSTPPVPSQPSVFAQAAPALIAGALKDVHDILTPPEVSIAQAQASRQGYYPQYGVPYGNTAPVPRTTGVGIGIDSQGIRLSDGSHLGWFPIVGVIGIIFLLQSPGFTRRSR